MATSDTQKAVDRARGIVCQLLKALPPAERDKHLARHLVDIQSLTDAVMGALAGERDKPPPSIRERASKTPPEPVESSESGPLLTEDAATVPGAIRAVLAGEKDGLSVRAIVTGVRLLRPGTSDALVHGALHQMKNRGELSRVGFHKNYKYLLVTSFGSESVSTAFNGGSSPDRGGETH